MPAKFIIIVIMFFGLCINYANSENNDDNIFAMDGNEHIYESNHLKDNANKSKNLSPKNNLDYSSLASKAAAYEDEFKKAVGRIEKLEHELATLKSQLNIVQRADNPENTVPVDKDNKQVDSVKPNLQLNANLNKAAKAENNAEKDEYNQALQLYKQTKYGEAEQKFNAYIKKFPSDKLISNCLFWLGEIHSKRKMYDKAAVSYLKSYKNSPKGDKASDSLLKLSFALGELKKLKEACSTLKKLENEFPNRSTASKKIAKDYQNKFQCVQN